MTTVKIHKQNKNTLKEYADGSYDEIITKLLNDTEDYLPIINVDYSIVSTMMLNENTVERLDTYRLTEGESYENIIMRLLVLSKSLNNSG